MQKGPGWEKAQFRTLPILQMGKTEAQGGWSLRSLQPPMWPQPTALPVSEGMTSQVPQDHRLGPARSGQQSHLSLEGSRVPEQSSVAGQSPGAPNRLGVASKKLVVFVGISQANRGSKCGRGVDCHG